MKFNTTKTVLGEGQLVSATLMEAPWEEINFSDKKSTLKVKHQHTILKTTLPRILPLSLTMTEDDTRKAIAPNMKLPAIFAIDVMAGDASLLNISLADRTPEQLSRIYHSQLIDMTARNEISCLAVKLMGMESLGTNADFYNLLKRASNSRSGAVLITAARLPFSFPADFCKVFGITNPLVKIIVTSWIQKVSQVEVVTGVNYQSSRDLFGNKHRLMTSSEFLDMPSTLEKVSAALTKFFNVPSEVVNTPNLPSMPLLIGHALHALAADLASIVYTDEQEKDQLDLKDLAYMSFLKDNGLVVVTNQISGSGLLDVGSRLLNVAQIHRSVLNRFLKVKPGNNPLPRYLQMTSTSRPQCGVHQMVWDSSATGYTLEEFVKMLERRVKHLLTPSQYVSFENISDYRDMFSTASAISPTNNGVPNNLLVSCQPSSPGPLEHVFAAKSASGNLVGNWYTVNKTHEFQPIISSLVSAASMEPITSLATSVLNSTSLSTLLVGPGLDTENLMMTISAPFKSDDLLFFFETICMLKSTAMSVVTLGTSHILQYEFNFHPAFCTNQATTFKTADPRFAVLDVNWQNTKQTKSAPIAPGIDFGSKKLILFKDSDTDPQLHDTVGLQFALKYITSALGTNATSRALSLEAAQVGCSSIMKTYTCGTKSNAATLSFVLKTFKNFSDSATQNKAAQTITQNNTYIRSLYRRMLHSTLESLSDWASDGALETIMDTITAVLANGVMADKDGLVLATFDVSKLDKKSNEMISALMKLPFLALYAHSTKFKVKEVDETVNDFLSHIGHHDLASSLITIMTEWANSRRAVIIAQAGTLHPSR